MSVNTRSIRKTTCILVSLLVCFQTTGFSQVFPPPAAASYRPPHLRWLEIDPRARTFNVLIDNGDEKDISSDRLTAVSGQLVNYFLTGLILPDSSFWVNLSPNDPHRIIDPLLEQTEIGRIFLDADVKLKKSLAQATSPSTPAGKKYWDSLYKEAERIFGPNDMEVSTAIRPWIVPGEIIIGEDSRGAYVYKALLDVRLREDNRGIDERSRKLNAFAAELLRKEVVPGLAKQVNTSPEYGVLRQVFYSLILAQWYKHGYKGERTGILANIDTSNTAPVASSVSWSKEPFVAAYLRSLRAGEYNRREYVRAASGTSVRQYVSGGLLFDGGSKVTSVPLARNALQTATAHGQLVTVAFPQSVNDLVPSADGGREREEIQSLALYGAVRHLIFRALDKPDTFLHEAFQQVFREGNRSIIDAAIPDVLEAMRSRERKTKDNAFRVMASILEAYPEAATDEVFDLVRPEIFKGAGELSRVVQAVRCLEAFARLYPEKLDAQVIDQINVLAGHKFSFVKTAAEKVITALSETEKGAPREEIQKKNQVLLNDTQLFGVLRGLKDEEDPDAREKNISLFAGLLKENASKEHLENTELSDKDTAHIASLVTDLILKGNPKKLPELWKTHAGDRAALIRALEQEVTESVLPGAYAPVVYWEEMTDQLKAFSGLLSHPKAAINSIIVKMTLAREGVLPFTRKKIGAMGGDLKHFRYTIAQTLRHIPSVSLQRHLIKAAIANREESVTKMRHRADQFEQATKRNGDVAHAIKKDIHISPSPRDLQSIEAYDLFLETGNPNDLAALGYRTTALDEFSGEHKQRVVAATKALLASAREIWGESRNKLTGDYFDSWKKTFRNETPLLNAVEAVIASPEGEMRQLEIINNARKIMSEHNKRLSGEQLMENIGMDCALEDLYFFSFAAFEPSIDYTDPMQPPTAIRNLLETVRYNGYCEEEIGAIIPQLDAIMNRGNLSKKDYLELYSLYRRLERMIKDISEQTIHQYKDIADRLGTASGTSESKWVHDFSAQLLRSDALYWLAVTLGKAKGSLMAKEKISDWQILQSGRARGRVRVLSDQEDISTLQKDEIVVMDFRPDDSRLLTRVAGVITSDEDCLLSHPAVKARESKTVLVSTSDLGDLKELAGQWIELSAKGETVTIEKTAKPAVSVQQTATIETGETVELIEPDLDWALPVALPDDYTKERVGSKADNLAKIPKDLLEQQVFARHFAVPFAVFDQALNSEANRSRREELAELHDRIAEAGESESIENELARARELIESLEIPEEELREIAATARRLIGQESFLFLRSSTNAEDLPGYSGAGLHDSFGGVRPTEYELSRHIRKVWASIWNDRAVNDRRVHGIDQRAVLPAVLIQEMIVPEYAFVIHTLSPVSGNADEIILEVVQGFGETLVSGERKYAGLPYSFRLDKKTRELEITAFANKSRKVVFHGGRFKDEIPSYLNDWILSAEASALLGEIGEAALELEKTAGTPQDIEGVIVKEGANRRAGFVQTRDEIFNKDGGTTAVDMADYPRSWRSLTREIRRIMNDPEPEKELRSLLVNLVFLREGLLPYSAFKGEVVEELGNGFYLAMEKAAAKTSSVPLRRWLVKAGSAGDIESIEKMRSSALDFARECANNELSARMFREGQTSQIPVSTTIRYNIHLRSSPKNLDEVKAYRKFLDGDPSDLIALGYEPGEIDAVPAERLPEAIEITDKLIEILEGMFGKDRGKASRTVFSFWTNDHRIKNAPVTKMIEQVIANPRESTLEHLSSINEGRRELGRLISKLRSEDAGRTLLTIGMDNSLQELYYSEFSILEPSIDYTDFSQLLSVVKNLLEAIALDGYCPGEIPVLQSEIDAIIKTNNYQYDRLRIQALYKRTERMLKELAEQTAHEYSQIARDMGKTLHKESPWVSDFSIELLKCENAYLLSLVIQKALKSLGIETWQVIKGGTATGRVRLLLPGDDIDSIHSGQIVVVDSLPLDDRIFRRAAAVISTGAECMLSHPADRARQHTIPGVTAPSIAEIKKLDGQWIELETQGDDVTIRLAEPKKLKVREEDFENENTPQPVKPDKTWRLAIVFPLDFTPGRVGYKAYRMRNIAGRVSGILNGQKGMSYFGLSFSLFDSVLGLPVNRAIKEEYLSLMNDVVDGPSVKVPAQLQRMRELIESLEIPAETVKEITETSRRLFGENAYLFVRSSTNAEDLPGYTGAGLYDSYGGVSAYALETHIKKVWASVWNDRAFGNRRAHRIDHTLVRPAVLIQQMLLPEYSFVIHTKAPNGNDAMIIEAVQGFGESLVSGENRYAGTPYRFTMDKRTSEIRLTAFADKSRKVVFRSGSFEDELTDYRNEWLLTSEGLALLQTAGQAALRLEQEARVPQGVEGVITASEKGRQALFVQTRDQVTENRDGGEVGGIDMTMMAPKINPFVPASLPGARGSLVGYSERECEALFKKILSEGPGSLEQIRDYVIEVSVRADAGARLENVHSWLSDTLRKEEEMAVRSRPVLLETLSLLATK